MKKLILATVSLIAFSLVTHAADPLVVEGPHNCCGGCLRAITKTLEKVRDVSVDQKKGTITAKGKSDAKKAVTALMDAGFYATADGKPGTETGSESKPAPTASTGKKVTAATVTGVHNCCLKCRNLIQDAMRETTGVKSVEIDPESPTFTLSGEFTHADIIASLNKAGFNGKIK